jgi:hypothetical protein
MTAMELAFTHPHTPFSTPGYITQQRRQVRLDWFQRGDLGFCRVSISRFDVYSLARFGV